MIGVGRTSITHEGVLLSPMMSGTFNLSAPKVVNTEFIPPDVLSSMIPAWHSNVFDARPVLMVRVKNVFVAGEGLIFKSSGELFEESITQHSSEEIDRACRQIDYAKTLQGPSVEETSVLCVKRGAENYGHWLIEMLPKAVLAKAELGQKSLKFIVPRIGGNLGIAIRDSLIDAGIQAEDIVKICPYPRFYKDLIVIDGLSHHGAYMSPQVVSSFMKDDKIEKQPNRKIYVKRNSYRTRRVHNHRELESELERREYRIVDPDTMSFDLQKQTFADATHVVGVMGAGMANIAFCQPGTKVVILAPFCMPDTFFWFLSGLNKHVYTEVRCKSVDSGFSDMDWNNDIVCPLHDVIDLL